MSPEAYLAELQRRTGLFKASDAQHGSILCYDLNHTHFEIPDPREMPDDQTRADVLEYVIAHLGDYALGY